MKKFLSVFTCVLLLSLSGCAASSTEISDSSAQTASNESSISSDVSDSAESSEQASISEKESESYSSLKLLAKENIHNAAWDDKITSYNAFVYSDNALYDVAESHNPDDSLQRDGYEYTYEIDETARTLSFVLPSGDTAIYTFDESGNFVEFQSKSSDGAIRFWYTLTYNDSGLPLQAIVLDDSGNETSTVWSYSYDDSGNITRLYAPNEVQWYEFTYDEEGYPLTKTLYDMEEKSDIWSSYEYEEISVKPLPDFIGSPKQWILIQLVLDLQ